MVDKGSRRNGRWEVGKKNRSKEMNGEIEDWRARRIKGSYRWLRVKSTD